MKTLTVADLIDRLQMLKPDAQVVVMQSDTLCVVDVVDHDHVIELIVE
jgi:hypothetical protein